MANTNPPMDWMSVLTAALQTGRSRSTIYRWAAKGDRLEEMRVGRRMFVRLIDSTSADKVTGVSTVSTGLDSPPDPDVPTVISTETSMSSSPTGVVVGTEQLSQSEGQHDLQFCWGTFYRIV